MQSVARILLSDWRTLAGCCRWRISKAAPVEVYRAKRFGRCHYGGLQRCSSVWVCPVCAAKISERRRAELASAIEQHRASGGDVVLMTLTNSHGREDVLATLLASQAVALDSFRTWRAGRELFAAFGVIGMIRALEVTHGQANGWHPHYHFLLFVDRARSKAAMAAWRDQVAEFWRKCCASAGVPLPSNERGVDVRDGTYAATYASKWGLESEMTKAHVKRGRKSSRTPFDMLRALLAGDDRTAGALFVQFAEAFKGKRQLVWSRGLKDRFRINGLSDEAIAESKDDPSDVLGLLEYKDWQLICHYEQRADVLSAAERGGWPAVEDLLWRLYEREARDLAEAERVRAAAGGL